MPRPQIQLAQRTASDTIAVRAPRWSRAQRHLGNPRLKESGHGYSKIRRGRCTCRLVLCNAASHAADPANRKALKVGLITGSPDSARVKGFVALLRLFLFQILVFCLIWLAYCDHLSAYARDPEESNIIGLR